jgi:RNA polymerase sigma-70 factor (ECF subfamily)
MQETSLPMTTDEELVQKTISGGSHHFGVLVERYSDYLFGLGMRLTSGNKEMSEDISQQAFLKSYSYLKSFDKKQSFKLWLTRIAVNSFKDLITKENQYSSNESPIESSHTPKLEGDQDFFNLIRPLSEDEKAIFILRFIYEYQVNEIGELLTMKPGTVKSKLSRAMEKLR